VHNAEKEFRTLKRGKKNKFHIDFLAIHSELEKETKEFVKTLKPKGNE
jgi:Uri superfamily endonuclease